MDKIKHLLEQQQYQQRHDEHLRLQQQQHRKALYAEVTEWLKQIGDDHEIKVLGDDYYLHLRLGYDQWLTLRFSPLSLNRSDQIATELTLFDLCTPKQKTRLRLYWHPKPAQWQVRTLKRKSRWFHSWCYQRQWNKALLEKLLLDFMTD